MKNIVIYDVKIGDKIKCPKTNEFKIVRDYDIWAKDKYINVWFEDNTMTRLSYGGFHPTWIEIEEKEIEENKYICNSCHEHYPENEMDFDEENESDICKNCNYISYNDAPYGDNEGNESKKVNSVTASKFLNWYFSDASDIRDFGNAMVEQMRTFGIANIDVKQLFDGCALIPQYICEDWDEDWGNEQEYSPEQIEFINDIDSH